MLSVSLSAVRLFRMCEQAYFLRHVEGLQRVDTAVHLLVGRMLHEYLQGYYERLQKNAPPNDAHVAAFVAMRDKWAPHLKAHLEEAIASGSEKRALELNNVLPSVRRIIIRYFNTRGRADADLYEVLVVEAPLNARIAYGIRNDSVIDLITREKMTGRVSLWEHKSAQSIPDADIRLHDLQTVLYRRIAEARFPFKINNVKWNYLRTKEPEVPDLLKNGKLTKKEKLDTTWEVYREAIQTNGLRETDYDDIRVRLQGREEEVYFPRFDLPYMADANLLLSDYQLSAQMIASRRKAWKSGTSHPVRSFAWHCSRCEFNLLCKAVLMGGDTDDVIRLKFRRRKEAQNGTASTSSPVAVAVGGAANSDSDDGGWDDLYTSLSAGPGDN